MCLHLLTRLTNTLLVFDSYVASQADVVVFKAITAAPKTPNAARWYTHIKSYTAEFDSLPGSSKAGEAFLGGDKAAAKEEEDDDDDVDLFGSDDEEEDAEAERIKAERIAAYNAKKANKPKAAAKVCVAFSYTIVYLCAGASCIPAVLRIILLTSTLCCSPL